MTMKTYFFGVLTGVMSIAILSASFAGDTGTATTTPATQAPLRYHLTVGQELVYQITETRLSVSNPAQPPYTSAMSDTLRVVAANADGGWHLIEMTQEIPGPQGARMGQPPQIGEFDLSPDGQVNIDQPTAMAIQPRNAFPLLPQDGTAKPWQQKISQDDQTISYTAQPTTQPSVLNTTSRAIRPCSSSAPMASSANDSSAIRRRWMLIWRRRLMR
jgi:hypothetical protein